MIIDFVNPCETYSGLPHANCMIFKHKKQVSNTSGIEYIRTPRILYDHYAKVLEAKRNKLNNQLINFFKPKPRVKSVVYP